MSRSPADLQEIPPLGDFALERLGEGLILRLGTCSVPGEGDPPRAVESRAARELARRACRDLLAANSHGPSDDRPPEWPADLTGCLAHSRGVVAALVGRAPPFTALGLDLETRTRLPERLWPRVLRPEERDDLRHRDPEEAAARAAIAFSAKEAFFKLQWTRTRSFLGLRDARVEVDLGRGTVLVERTLHTPALAAAPQRQEGLFHRDAERLITVLADARPPG